jgi:hypothetical protein
LEHNPGVKQYDRRIKYRIESTHFGYYYNDTMIKSANKVMLIYRFKS